MESLKELVARVLGVSKDEINNESSPDNIKSWDSFNGLMLVSELEMRFDVKFSIDEVMGVTKYKDIKDALEKHNVREGID